MVNFVLQNTGTTITTADLIKWLWYHQHSARWQLFYTGIIHLSILCWLAPQSTSGGLYLSTVLPSTFPCWRQLPLLDEKEDIRVLLSNAVYTVS